MTGKGNNQMDKVTPSQFAPVLVSTLAELTDFKPQAPVAKRDLYKPVCERMGIQEDLNGELSSGILYTHRQIDLAFKLHLKDKGLGLRAKRGHWALNEAGVAYAKTLSQPKASEVSSKEEEGTSTKVPTDSSSNENPYRDDPYLVSLAIERSSCFGYWSERAPTCKSCPLESRCKLQIEVVKGELAATLEDAFPEEEEKSSFDELLEEVENSSQPTISKFKPPKGAEFARIANNGVEGFCVHCNEVIPEGTPAMWCRREGTFHVECFDDS